MEKFIKEILSGRQINGFVDKVIFNASSLEKRAIKEGKEQIKKGEYLTLQSLKNELGH